MTHYKYFGILIFAIFSIMILHGNISAADLTNFDISVSIESPTSAKVVETWYVLFNTLKDQQAFSASILAAGINVDEFAKINPKLTPHIYINKYEKLSIGFDEIHSTVRLEYDISDTCLIKYLEDDYEIIWKLNENLFKNFVMNDVYYIPKDSYIRTSTYAPLIIEAYVPSGDVLNNQLSWTAISSNELRLLAVEKKPPKPSFVLTLGFEKNDSGAKNYFIIILIVLVLLAVGILFFSKPLSKSIKKFVMKHTVIKPKQKKKDLFDYDFFKE